MHLIVPQKQKKNREQLGPELTGEVYNAVQIY